MTNYYLDFDLLYIGIYRTGNFPDYNVACGGISVNCIIPYARNFVWRAEPIIVGNFSVGNNLPHRIPKLGVVSLLYKTRGVSTIKLAIEDQILTNVTYISLECMEATSDRPTILTLRVEICKYNSTVQIFQLL